MANQSKIINLLREHLQAGEAILENDNNPVIIDGQYEVKMMGEDHVRKGFLIATNQRVIFYAKKLTGYEIESFPYVNISSFEGGKNFMGNNIKIIASGNTAYVKWITDKKGFQILLNTVHSEMAKSKTLSSKETPSSNSFADEITKISKLLENNLISEEEFQSLKKRIISDI
jgi:hypothetical protein